LWWVFTYLWVPFLVITFLRVGPSLFNVLTPPHVYCHWNYSPAHSSKFTWLNIAWSTTPTGATSYRAATEASVEYSPELLHRPRVPVGVSQRAIKTWARS